MTKAELLKLQAAREAERERLHTEAEAYSLALAKDSPEIQAIYAQRGTKAVQG